jgi:hypothetical protein
MKSLRILSTATALCLVSGLATAFASADGQRSGLEIEQVPVDMDASNQAGWWHPLDVHDGTPYFAVNSPAADPGRHEVHIATRSSSGEWTIDCVKEADGACAHYVDDIGHNQPSIVLDGDGYIHAFVSMHNDRWRYFRSEQPEDVTTMVNRSEEVPDPDAGVTYPRLALAPSGDVYLMARVNVPGVGHTGRLYRWTVDDETWQLVSVFTPGHSESGLVPYPDDIKVDDEGNVHLLWEWARGSTSNLRYHGSYLVYQPAADRFVTISGTEIDVPVTPDDDEVVFDAGEGAFRQARFALVNGSPHLAGIAYRYRPTADDNYEVRWAWWDGAEWRRELVDPGDFESDVGIGTTHHGSTARVYYMKSPSCEFGEQRGLFVAEKRVTAGHHDESWTPRWLGVGPAEGIDRMAAMSGAAGTDVLYLAAHNTGHPTLDPALYFASVDRYPPVRPGEAAQPHSVSQTTDRTNWAHRADVEVSSILRASSIGECAVDGNYWADWSRWLSSYYEDEPWITVTLDEPIQVDEVHVYSGYSPTGNAQINPDLAVDLLIDGEWIEVARVLGNTVNPAVLTVEEPAHLEYTDQVRLRVLNMQNPNHNARIFELEVYSIADGAPLRTSVSADPSVLLFPGDATEVAATFTNRSGEPISGVAEQAAPDGRTVTPADHSYELEPHDSEEAIFTIESPADAGPASVEVTLRAADHGVENTVELQVRDGVILSDDGAPAYTETGDWADSPRQGYDGSGSRYTPIPGGAPGATATWTPPLPRAGTYRVHVWYPSSPQGSTAAASYTVAHADGTTDLVVDQNEDADSWRLLGEWEFEAGSTGSVTLTATTSGYHRANAVRFEAVAE